MDYRAKMLELCDSSIAYFDKQFDDNDGKSVVLQHEANGAMAALIALKKEIEKVPYVAKKAAEDPAT